MKICIVVPMFNENEIAEHSLKTILSYTSKLPPTITVLVVNDGSSDATESIVEKLIAERSNDDLQLISLPINRGYGAALLAGMNFAVDHNYDYTLFMDSDLTNHPKYLQAFYNKMAAGYDYIKATRYAQGGGTACVPWQHRIMSVLGNSLARILYGLPLTDLTNGFRAVKTDILKKMLLHEPDFSIIMEELYYAKCLANSFSEVPFVLGSRADGQGKSKFSYNLRTIAKYLKYPITSLLRSLMLTLGIQNVDGLVCLAAYLIA